MFEGMIKHTGIIANTGKNVVVVFMSLPEDPEYALVIDTDALPDSFNEALRKIVERTDGQQAENLADLLARRMSPDGSNTTMLQKFHGAGRLQKVSIDLVTMTPRRGLNWPLRDIVTAMKGQKANEPTGFDDLDPETRAQIAAEMGKFNVHASNAEGETAAGKKAEAAGLIRMAELLENDASAKRQQAYKMDPSLMRANKAKAEAKVEAPVATVKVAAPKKPAAAKAKATTAKKPAAKATATKAKTSA